MEDGLLCVNREIVHEMRIRKVIILASEFPVSFCIEEKMLWNAKGEEPELSSMNETEEKKSKDRPPLGNSNNNQAMMMMIYLINQIETKQSGYLNYTDGNRITYKC